MKINNVEEIVVKYKTIKGGVNTKLDKIFEKVAEEIGLELVGSGYEFKTKKRDLQFKQLIYAKKNTPKSYKVSSGLSGGL